MVADSKDVADNQRALMEFYSSNTVQFAGFTLSLGLIFLGLVQVLVDAKGPIALVTIPPVFAALAGILVLGGYLVPIGIFWNRMTDAAIEIGAPLDLGESNSMSELRKRHYKYVREKYGWIKEHNIGATDFIVIITKRVMPASGIVCLIGFAIEFLLYLHPIG